MILIPIMNNTSSLYWPLPQWVMISSIIWQALIIVSGALSIYRAFMYWRHFLLMLLPVHAENARWFMCSAFASASICAKHWAAIARAAVIDMWRALIALCSHSEHSTDFVGRHYLFLWFRLIFGSKCMGRRRVGTFIAMPTSCHTSSMPLFRTGDINGFITFITSVGDAKMAAAFWRRLASWNHSHFNIKWSSIAAAGLASWNRPAASHWRLPGLCYYMNSLFLTAFELSQASIAYYITAYW